MNTVFHLASALFTVLVLYWLLRVQKQRDFLRRILQEASSSRKASGAGRRVVVEAPLRYLEAFASALGLPLEKDEGPALPPARLEPGVLADLFLSHGLSLIRWKTNKATEGTATVELELTESAATRDPPPETSSVARALGGGVHVVYVQSKSAPSATR